MSNHNQITAAADRLAKGIAARQTTKTFVRGSGPDLAGQCSARVLGSPTTTAEARVWGKLAGAKVTDGNLHLSAELREKHLAACTTAGVDPTSGAGSELLRAILTGEAE